MTTTTPATVKIPTQHLSIRLDPRAAGLTPYRVQVTRPPSPPISSMLDEGVIWCDPERRVEVVVWAKDEAAIADVLNYHYYRGWSGLTIVPSSPTPSGQKGA